MKSKVFFRYLAAGSIVLLGLVYPGLAALYSCARGHCWSGMSAKSSLSLAATGVACIQLFPVVFSFIATLAGFGTYFKCVEEDEDDDIGLDVYSFYIVSVIFTTVTVGLTCGGLVCLKSCADGKCCHGLSSAGALSMFLSGQIVNFLVHFLVYLLMTDMEDSKALQRVCDFWSVKKRRQVCSDAAVPA